MATRARRWAKELSLTADSERLRKHADELDREAAELERPAAEEGFVPRPTRTVIQMQTQQAGDAPKKADDDTDKSKA